MKRLLTNRNRASLTGIVVDRRDSKGKLWFGNLSLHNFRSRGGKVEARNRETKIRDFISIERSGLHEIRKLKESASLQRKLAFFVIEWIRGDLESRQLPPTFIYRNFFSLPLCGKDGVSSQGEILAKKLGAGIIHARPRKLWIRVFDDFVPLQSIFPCSKLLTARGPQHLISARLRAVRNTPRQLRSFLQRQRRDKLLKIPLFPQSFPVRADLPSYFPILFPNIRPFLLLIRWFFHQVEIARKPR